MDCATYFSFLKCNFCHFYFRFLHRWHLDLLLEIIQFLSLPILLIEGFRFPDLPDLTQTFSIKEGLSPALSVRIPIAFESGYYSVSYLHLIYCETHNFFCNLENVLTFSPYICLFHAPPSFVW